MWFSRDKGSIALAWGQGPWLPQMIFKTRLYQAKLVLAYLVPNLQGPAPKRFNNIYGLPKLPNGNRKL